MKNKKAFTLIEVLMTISLVSILTVASISMFDASLNEARFDATYKEMLQLRKALIGDLENTTIEGDRIRFGFLGDMGGLPPMNLGLGMLNTKPVSTPLYVLDNASKLGAGWNGPYISSTENEDYLKDAWNRNYIYRTDTAVPYVLSFGADGAQGGEGVNQDIQVEIPLSIRVATVHGQITSSGSVLETPAHVEIFYPNGSGVLTSQTVTLTNADAGRFSFSNIPFGVRTIKVQIPNAVSPQVTLGPVTFAVDDQNYFLRSNALEVNPQATNANCNTISNMTYEEGTFVNDVANSKIIFQLNIRNSFATRNVYTTNNGAGPSTSTNLAQLGIGGVVYGCTNFVDIALYGGIDRKFTQCARFCCLNILGICLGQCDVGYVNLNTHPNLTLNSSWGIPSGERITAFMKFDGSTAAMTRADLQIGCDLVRIE